MAPGKLVDGITLSDVTVEDVKPLSPGSHREFEVMKMNFRDLIFKNFMCPSIFAYRDHKNSGDTLEKVKRMKLALSRTLDLFYPAAGRYVLDPSTVGLGPGRAQPHLLCNDAGVPFVEGYADYFLDDILPTGENANVQDFEVSKVSELYMRGNDLFGKDLGPKSGPFDRDVPDGGLPALVIQVTRFRCGGVVMAPVYPHMLMDGMSFGTFMRVWSDMAVSGETTIVPDLHREYGLDLPSFEEMNVPPPSEMRPPAGPFIKRIFEVSRSAIESMKQEVQRETNGSRYVSTADCISAHFWHSLVRLASTAQDLSGKVVYPFVVVEGRTTSTEPPLSRYLWGNVMNPMLHPVLPPNELLGKPASSAALRLRDHLKSRNNPSGWRSTEHFKEFIECVSYNKSGVTWATTALLAFPFYDTEFDLLGKPRFVCPATTGMQSEGDFGRAVLYPPLPLHREKSSATAHLELNPEWLDLLCSDPYFMSLFLDDDVAPQ